MLRTLPPTLSRAPTPPTIKLRIGKLPSGPTASRSGDDSISIAVVGGGIGGVCLAIGLLKYPHINVHVYEAASSFGEIGAGVAFGPNSERALAALGPDALEAFRKQATPNLWLSYADGVGKAESTLICNQNNSLGMQSLHRAHFLDELVKAVPAHRTHFHKRLEKLEEVTEGVILHFRDGQSTIADVVIGADGIHGHTREYLIGSEAAKARFSGSIVHRGLAPMESAVELLGEEHAHNCVMLCGPDRAMMSYPIDGGKTLNIIAFDTVNDWTDENWIVPARYEELLEKYREWGKPAQRVLKSLWEAPPAPTFTKSRVAMMGDAAHAMVPYQGQGAGQAIEDASVLQELLGRVHHKGKIVKALSVYDQVRRPRAERVVATSREAGYLFTMQAEGVKDDVVKMRENIEKRMEWIWGQDIQAQNQAAVDLFEDNLRC
ncbi:MAG: hypothetical protein Q9188_005395 [Gyalolechia gomerana]